MIHPANKQLLKIDAAALAIIVGLGAAAYLVQIGPTIGHHQQARAASVELSDQQARQRELERLLRVTLENLDVTRQAAAQAELQLEPLSQLNARLARLTELASSNHLLVDSIESGSTSHRKRYTSVAIRISGRGSYRNCVAALRQLRSSMPDMGVVGLQMSAGTPLAEASGAAPGSAAGTSATNASFNFELLWFASPGDQTAEK